MGSRTEREGQVVRPVCRDQAYPVANESRSVDWPVREISK